MSTYIEPIAPDMLQDDEGVITAVDVSFPPERNSNFIENRRSTILVFGLSDNPSVQETIKGLKASLD